MGRSTMMNRNSHGPTRLRTVPLVLAAALAVILVAGTGCQSLNRGVHTIPVSRDYGQLEEADIEQAETLVAEAQRSGAQHFAPYDYYSSATYLQRAYEDKKESDRLGMWDYAALSRDAAQRALAAPGGIPDRGEMTMPEDREAAQAEFDRLKARFLELDRDKAIEVAPVLYAEVTTALSWAEHEMNEPRQWVRAMRAIQGVEPNIDTIWAQDVDGDGIIDMKDAAPWEPEDMDNFEDADGKPDPDNDQDSVVDVVDQAPMDPETRNRWHDFDGAPDQYPGLETLYFGSGSAALSKESQGYLRGISVVMKEWPGLVLQLAGHTDNVHGEEFNIELSKKRVEAVQGYLTLQGVPETQLRGTYHGEKDPAADNGTAKGRAMNRRVELILE